MRRTSYTVRSAISTTAGRVYLITLQHFLSLLQFNLVSYFPRSIRVLADLAEIGC